MTKEIQAICDAASVAAEVVRTSQNHGHLANQLDDAVRSLTEWECRRQNAITEHAGKIDAVVRLLWIRELVKSSETIKKAWQAVTGL